MDPVPAALKNKRAAEMPAARFRGFTPRHCPGRLGRDALKRGAELLEPVDALLDDIHARGVAEADGAVIAESDSGDNRHMMFA